MTNAERNAKLFSLARQVIETAWPGKVTITAPDRDSVRLEVRLDTEDDTPPTVIPCTTPTELMQLGAALWDEWRPDMHWVYDSEKKKVVQIDAVDYTVETLTTRFRPLPRPSFEEHYSVEEKNGKRQVVLTGANGDASIVEVE